MKQLYFLTGFLLLIVLPVVTQAIPKNNVIEFVENKGQWKGDFLYQSVTGHGDVYLDKRSVTYVMGESANIDKVDAVKHGWVSTPQVLRYHIYQMVFEGALVPAVTGSKYQPYYNNYFLGNDPSKWKSEIHPCKVVDYKNLYAGIDAHMSSENNNLKYEFVVNPGADASQIKLRFDGVDKLSLKKGSLVIGTSVGEVQELKPYVYQYIGDKKVEVACRYELNGNTVNYTFPDGYDANEILVIDPTVVFCTMTGSTADNWGFTATYDAAGNFYAGGLVHHFIPGQPGYPGFPGSFFPTLGAFQTTYGGGSSTTGSLYPCDMAIIKFNASGTTKIYATYLGGSDNDQPHSMIVDANNNLVIAGRTYSADYPVTTGCFDNTQNGGADLVITKLNATGTALLGSTFIGGSGDDAVNYNAIEDTFGRLKHNYGDDARSEVLVDNAGNIYVTASTKSVNFPTTVNAYQTTLSGTQDAVVCKLNPTLTSLLWSTYLGGTSDDAGYVLALDNSQTHLYVGGGTQSSNFPSTAGTVYPSYQGGFSDGFIVRFLNSAPYTLQNGTFMGRSDYDQVYGVQIDANDNVYAMGQTLGGTFPVSAGVYSNPGSSQFVIKLNPTLTTNIYSTVFGSGTTTQTNISPVAFLVDTCQNVYISGWGGSLAIPTTPASVGNTVGLPIYLNGAPVSPSNPASPGQQTTTDGADFYFIVFRKDAVNLLYSSFFGRINAFAGFGEHVDGGTSRFNKDGIVYQAICASCGGQSNPPFPTTPGVWSEADSSVNCNEACLKIAFNFVLHAVAHIGPDTIGCSPLTVNFANNSTYATSYEWDFGDLTNSTLATPPPHTYTTPGTYHIRLIAINPNGCNKTRDTTYTTIIVKTGGITSGFNYTVTDSCGPYKASFTNTSVYSPTPGSSTFTTFIWKFGDGSPNYTGVTPPAHTYPAAGSYTVTLIMRDTTACNNPDSIKKTIIFGGNLVKAGFRSPDSVCLGAPVAVTDTSKNATTFAWTFGDGHAASTSSPSYIYPAVGTYTIWQVVTNPGSCNKKDSQMRTVTVMPLAIADFDYSPHIPVTNKPVQFINQSQGATSYVWNFGDNSSSTEKDPSHLYKRTGKYHVCLVAKTSSGCPDTTCKDVEADVRTLADVPTGFSPNGDGHNDILYVRGGAIEKMDFKIFNRWGELVFESNALEVGWDGTYKGKPQQMDAYAFVLNVTFIDGNTFFKKGNVTLVR